LSATDQKTASERFAAAKRELFDNLYRNLNDRQREAVYAVKGPLLVLAGAGSGKTTVLVNRAAHIIRYGNAVEADIPFVTEERVREAEALADEYRDCEPERLGELAERLKSYAAEPCPPWAVLCITFTNKAANEMKSRLVSVIGEEAGEVWAGTFHSVALRILRRWSERIGYAPGFSIYDVDDTKRVISDCLKRLNIDEKILPVKRAANDISRAKDRLLTPEDYAANAGMDYRLRQISQVYTEYQNRLRESNGMDFDDIIMQTVRLLETDEEARSWCQRRFKYVLADEYQDTNTAQFRMISLIGGLYGNIMAVGDDDQSIYRFRGATIENILNFEREFDGARTVRLEQNYRSTQNILNAANSVIANNTSRHEKTLWTENIEGEPVKIKQLETQNEEARYIINTIMELFIREKRQYSDFAVLYRVNAQSNSLEQVFMRSGIPYRVLGNLRFYERKEVRDIMAYLHVINNPADNLRLKRIINEPKRKIGDATVNAVELIAGEYGASMYQIMTNADQHTALSKSANKLRDFVALIERLRSALAGTPIDALVNMTIEQTGYLAMLEAEGEEGSERIDNIRELVTNASQYMERTGEPTLSGFLEETALISDIDNYDSSADAITLMTIHSAKGLEFPVVFLPGMEEGLFPGIQSLTAPEELEEERRLAYVAMTRAKDRLFITHARQRMLYGRTQYNQLSRFAGEIGDEYAEVEEAEKPEPKPTTRSERAKRGTISSELTRRSRKPRRDSTYEKFEVGDIVSHATFGRGEILSASEVGADTLYEVAFETVGTKKLMATYARLRRHE